METGQVDASAGAGTRAGGCLSSIFRVGLGLFLGALAGIVLGLLLGVGLAMILGVL
jgi:ABC-type nitrate/sulfonate/bicarbonate transport system permease component